MEPFGLKQPLEHHTISKLSPIQVAAGFNVDDYVIHSYDV